MKYDADVMRRFRLRRVREAATRGAQRALRDMVRTWPSSPAGRTGMCSTSPATEKAPSVTIAGSPSTRSSSGSPPGHQRLLGGGPWPSTSCDYAAPLVEVPVMLWAELMTHLREQGAGVRESGAFLVGRTADAGRVVLRFLSYRAGRRAQRSLRGGVAGLARRGHSVRWPAGRGTCLGRGDASTPRRPGPCRSGRAAKSLRHRAGAAHAQYRGLPTSFVHAQKRAAGLAPEAA